jgi:hypothetical protein
VGERSYWKRYLFLFNNAAGATEIILQLLLYGKKRLKEARKGCFLKKNETII